MVKIVTLIDINRAIVDNITLALSDTGFKDVEFSSMSIEEDIIRPSFYLDFDNNKTNRFNYSLKERNLNIRLFYFAKTRDNSKFELLKIQDILENLFLKEIKITEDFYFPSVEVEFDVDKKNGYLTMNLELYSLEEIDFIQAITDNAEPMETLEIDTKIN